MSMKSNLPVAVSDLRQLVMKGSRFGCIYADPPWQYQRNPRGAAIHHYPTMSIEELKSLPVKELAATQSHLHLWTTNSFMKEAHELLETWGFSYKSMFTWVKFQIGTGYYWRGATEHLLLGVRGKQRFSDKGMRNWLLSDREEHSSKPEAVRRLIEKASPPPYLELFGRKTTDNWVVFGNQVRHSTSNQPRSLGRTTTTKKLRQVDENDLPILAGLVKRLD